MFTNLEIDIDSIPKLEEVNLKPISKQYLKIMFFNIFVQYCMLFGFLIIGKNLIKEAAVTHYFWYAVSGLIVLLIVQSIISIQAFKKRGYNLRTHDIIYAKGLITHRKTTVPFIRIQHLEIKQSFIAKTFGLASLHVYTAGESGGDLSINGLTLAEAEQINEILTANLN